MSVVFQGFSILLEVKVGVAQLAVDGSEGLQVFCADLDGCLKKCRPAFKVSGLAQTFSFQCQLQAGGLHPKHEGFHKQMSTMVRKQHSQFLNVSSECFSGPLYVHCYFILRE